MKIYLNWSTVLPAEVIEWLRDAVLSLYENAQHVEFFDFRRVFHVLL